VEWNTAGGGVPVGPAGPIQAHFWISVLFAQEVVVNGSFESGVDPGMGTQLNSPDSTTITGWTVDSGNVDYIGGNRWTAGDGARCLDLSGVNAGSIKQTLSSLNIGQLYRLTFLMAGNNEQDPGLKQMRVHIGSYTQDFQFNSSGHSTNN